MDLLEKDTKFLSENNIIDYSLLVGIHILDLDKENNKNLFDTPVQMVRNNRASSPLVTSKMLNQHRKISMNTNIINQFLVDNKDTWSVGERKNINLNLEDDPSDFSLYNKEINYSENESQAEHENKKTELDDGFKHPYRDVK